MAARWAEAACRRQELPASPENMRAQLGVALNLVRFPLMSVEEFAAGPAQSGVLTDREVVQLFLYFTVSAASVSVLRVRYRRWQGCSQSMSVSSLHSAICYATARRHDHLVIISSPRRLAGQVNPKPLVSFSETQRSCMMGVEQTACRFSQVEARWGYSGTSDRIM